MNYIKIAFDIFLHLDKYLNILIGQFGTGAFAASGGNQYP